MNKLNCNSDCPSDKENCIKNCDECPIFYNVSCCCSGKYIPKKLTLEQIREVIFKRDSTCCPKNKGCPNVTDCRECLIEELERVADA